MTKSKGMGRGRRPRRPLAERFWAKVQKGAPDQCWPWLGAQHGKGYGHIGAGGTDGLVMKASRASWEIHFGPIPVGKKVRHTCDNPPCVNPDHLKLGTHKENMEDMAARGRRKGKRGPYGDSHPFAKVTAKKARKIRVIYAGGKISQGALGARFGLCQQAISRIVLKQNWGHA